MDKKTEDLIKAYKDERFNDCLLIANNLLKEDKNNLQVLSYKAGALKNLGRYKEAIDALNECITLNRDSWYLWVFRGDCYYELGDLEKACSDYWFSLQFEPQNGAVMDKIARILFLLGDINNALNYINKAVELSESPEPALVMIIMLRKMGYPNYAKEISNIAIKKFPLKKEEFDYYLIRDL